MWSLWSCVTFFSLSDCDVWMGGTYTVIFLPHLWTLAADLGNTVLSGKGREQPKGTAPADWLKMLNVPGSHSIEDKVPISWDDHKPWGPFAYDRIYPLKWVGEWMGCVMGCSSVSCGARIQLLFITRGGDWRLGQMIPLTGKPSIWPVREWVGVKVCSVSFRQCGILFDNRHWIAWTRTSRHIINLVTKELGRSCRNRLSSQPGRRAIELWGEKGMRRAATLQDASEEIYVQKELWAYLVQGPQNFWGPPLPLCQKRRFLHREPTCSGRMRHQASRNH